MASQLGRQYNQNSPSQPNQNEAITANKNDKQVDELPGGEACGDVLVKQTYWDYKDITNKKDQKPQKKCYYERISQDELHSRKDRRNKDSDEKETVTTSKNERKSSVPIDEPLPQFNSSEGHKVRNSSAAPVLPQDDDAQQNPYAPRPPRRDSSRPPNQDRPFMQQRQHPQQQYQPQRPRSLPYHMGSPNMQARPGPSAVPNMQPPPPPPPPPNEACDLYYSYMSTPNQDAQSPNSPPNRPKHPLDRMSPIMPQPDIASFNTYNDKYYNTQAMPNQMQRQKPPQRLNSSVSPMQCAPLQTYSAQYPPRQFHPEIPVQDIRQSIPPPYEPGLSYGGNQQSYIPQPRSSCRSKHCSPSSCSCPRGGSRIPSKKISSRHHNSFAARSPGVEAEGQFRANSLDNVVQPHQYQMGQNSIKLDIPSDRIQPNNSNLSQSPQYHPRQQSSQSVQQTQFDSSNSNSKQQYNDVPKPPTPSSSTPLPPQPNAMKPRQSNKSVGTIPQNYHHFPIQPNSDLQHGNMQHTPQQYYQTSQQQTGHTPVDVRNNSMQSGEQNQNLGSGVSPNEGFDEYQGNINDYQGNVNAGTGKQLFVTMPPPKARGMSQSQMMASGAPPPPPPPGYKYWPMNHPSHPPQPLHCENEGWNENMPPEYFYSESDNCDIDDGEEDEDVSW